MRALRRFLRRVANFTTGHRNDERLQEEMESHLTAMTEENIRAGMVPALARREARLKFGAVELVRGEYRAETGLPFVEDALMDLRYAFRVLRNSPAFTLVATMTLMLGIGINVVAFGVVSAVLLRPLEISEPQNLYQLRLQPRTKFKLLTTSYPAFKDYRQRNTTFSALGGFYGYCQATLHGADGAKRVSGYATTSNYFDLLGVQPEVGRFFHEADEHGPNPVPGVVLSHDLWRSAFHADPAVVGTTVHLDKDSFTVVGVAPARFHGTERFVWPDYWIPIVNYFGADYLQDRVGIPLAVLGRLKAGATPEQAAEDLSAIAAQLGREYPRTDTGIPLRLIRPGLYGDNGDVIRRCLYSVAGLALLVLLAACTNLAGLFAARAADRSRELALRVALGAGRWRLVRQVITEAMVVSVLGGVAGLITASYLLRLLSLSSLPSFLGQTPASHVAVTVDAGVYLVAAILTLASGLLFGMLPARTVLRSRPLQAMKNGSLVSTPRRGFTLRDCLLGAQIAVCTLLVSASLVALRGMERLLHAPLGFQPQGAFLTEMDLSEMEVELPPEKVEAMLQAVRRIPGVMAAGTLSKVPFTGGLRGIPIFAPGTTELTLKNAALEPYRLTISPGYLEAAGTRLRRGRDVSWRDNSQAPYVALVNETLAHKMWGDTSSALGKRFIFLDHLREVVGVTEDGKYDSVGEPPQAVVYLPQGQSEQGLGTFVVRSSRPEKEMTAALTRTLSALEPNAPITVQSWTEAMAGALFAPRMTAAALGVMGLLAAVLAVTGIFGMATSNVSRRMKELAIRVALGARANHVLSAAIGRPAVLLGIGSSVGLLVSACSGYLLEQIVEQPNPRDPMVVIGAVLTMALLGLAASAIPALRALAVHPSKLVRED